ncbi:DNA nucleotidylexotransferase-like isoform X1 [Asterias amurensis]|uniref:DNA nucleotidylexotransferase-like isoform X1 n=1 Tax=Asterias amurensis TaxID=7602 RepID=UPI003AB1E955
MAAPMKRRKVVGVIKESIVFPIKFPEISIFIVDRKIQRIRLEHLKKLAGKNGFPVCEKLDESVTHIVSELETREEVLEILERSTDVNVGLLLENAEIVSMRWFSSCMEEGAPVEVTQEHQLKETDKKVTSLPSCPAPTKAEYQDAKFSCQRRTPLYHHNKKLTDALETLEKQADFLGGDQNSSRALAFRKASAALKALPRPVRSMREVENLNDLKGGKHCKRLIQEILEEGFSPEVEGILDDEWFKTMKIFTGVFGCGAATGRKWYDMKLRTLDDVKRCPRVTLTTEQRYGIDLYDDINTPVSRQEADVIQQIVAAEAEKILPGTTVTITGGFSRGKETGHDVDLLISHPMEGKEKGLLAMILNSLQKSQLLEYTDVQNSSYSEAAIRQVRRNLTMDHFERCFSIFRLPKHLKNGAKDSKLRQHRAGCKDSDSESDEEGVTAAEPQTVDRAGRVVDALGDVVVMGMTKRSGDDVETRLCSSVGVSEERGAREGESGLQFRNADSLAGARQTDIKIPSDDVTTITPRDSEQSCRDRDLDGGLTRSDWVARRVDFIITPQSQYAYALMGWIGSRMFNRSIRDYANKEMNMTLTSHGLFDKVNNKFLLAKNQKEIFEHLKLDYREPRDRNC